jgi:exosome complex component RRP42
MLSFGTTFIKKQQITSLLSSGKRLDERGLTDYREIQLKTGVIERAEGSSHIHLGKTEVMVGIKIEAGRPFPDVPDKGVLTVNAELVPLASPMFEPGPPGENAVELARVVDRGLRESNAIELEKLCLVPGKKVFVIFVDLYILNHDGNLIDASGIASLAALLNTKVFNYEVKDEKTEIKPGYTQLALRNHPIPVTFAKIEDQLIIDPSLQEEQVMDARITITIEKEGKICAMQKGGNGGFTTKEVLEAVKTAQKKAEEIRNIVLTKNA